MSKVYLSIVSIVMVFCCACGLMVEQNNHGHTAGQITQSALANCQQKGGEIKKAGIQQMPHCVVTYQDAGKPCKGAAQCVGRCLLIEKTLPAGSAVVGECQHTNLVFGCYAEVEGGISGPALCID